MLLLSVFVFCMPLHQRILKLAGVRPSYLNNETGGILINDLDCM